MILGMSRALHGGNGRGDGRGDGRGNRLRLIQIRFSEIEK